MLKHFSIYVISLKFNEVLETTSTLFDVLKFSFQTFRNFKN